MRENFDSKEVKEAREKAPVIYIELCDRRGSGFYLDANGVPAGTRGTKNEVQLDSPTARFIPNTAFRLAKSTNEKGDVEYYNEEIRFIKNQREISVARQKQLGIEPRRGSIEDKIILEKGNMSVAREGALIGLYDYIIDSFYNEGAIGRPVNLPAIYRIVEVDEEADDINEYDTLVADAILFVKQFYQKVGKNEYKYNEDKINGLCQLFAVFAETNSQKVVALNGMAKRDPKYFLEKAVKFEQTTITEITHGLELGVIAITKGTVEYVAKEKIIRVVGEKLKKDKQIENLSDWFRTSEGNEAYTEFRAELEAAKEKSLQNK